MNNEDLHKNLYSMVTRETPTRPSQMAQTTEITMTPKQAVPIVKINDWLDKPEEPEKPVVDNLIWGNTFCAIVGSPKSGKSTLARQLAYCIATGEMFLGHETVQQPVLYLALEEYSGRVREHFRTLGVKSEDPLYIVWDRLRNNPYDLVIEGLKLQLQELQIGVLIIDTAVHMPTKGATGVMDYNESINWWSDYLDIAHQLGVCVILIYHMPKNASNNPNRNPINSIFGSTGLGSIVDQAYAVWINDDGIRSFESEGRLPVLNDTLLDFNADRLWSELGAELTINGRLATKTEHKTERVWGALIHIRDRNDNRFITRESVVNQCRMNSADLQRALEGLEHEGKIEITRSNKGYTIEVLENDEEI